MVVPSNTVATRRLDDSHRKVRSSLSRTDLHLQKKRGGGRVLTPAEKTEKDAKRKKRRTNLNIRLGKARSRIWSLAVELSVEFGHGSKHWHRTLMQLARVGKSKKKPNRWNAYRAIKIKEKNDGP